MSSKKIATITFISSLLLGSFPLFAQTKEDAEKWLKNARDTLNVVEQVARELIQKGIEEKAKFDPAIESEWKSANEWLAQAKKELEKAEKLCSQNNWKECANTANWAWQLLVKTATAAINAGRAAGLK